MNDASPARLYATLVGGALVVAGILGFFYSSGFSTGKAVGRESEEVLGLLAVNGWHNLIHIATGLLGLAAAAYAARTYALALGLTYTLIAIWGFLVTDDGFGSLISTVPVNTEDNFLHLILGLTGLAAGAATPKPGGATNRGPSETRRERPA
ncbi:MAG: DUF4383 domain-containing protein [Actinomycetota bacterium]|nr:DUF4383 domain-containing protein [Actinomycetota bacterium]